MATTSAVRVGDSVVIGPFTAEHTVSGPINLTGAKIWASVCLTRDGAPLVTKKNSAGGGSDEQIVVTNAAGGIFYVKLGTGDTDDFEPGTKYYLDARVTMSNGEVHTVGEASFKMIDPYTSVPA
jgi:hypothetical protein